MSVSPVTQAVPDARAKRDRLRDIIGERSVATGDFELASGGRSNLYFEMKESLLDPEGIDLAADLILEAIEQRFPDAEAVGGLELGACPIATAVCLKSRGGRNLAGFYVRKERKKRGARELIDGPVGRGARVVIVEDVTTKGGSAMQAVRAVREELDCQVLAVVTVVDREEGARDALAREGLELIPLFLMKEFEGWGTEPPR
jgi:orotate phosphoribosyltransferase